MTSKHKSHICRCAILLCLVLSVSIHAHAQAGDICNRTNALNDSIRDGHISRKAALLRLQQLLPAVKKYYYEHAGSDTDLKRWIFPIAGYKASAIGGKNGNGYIASGYDFFDGNKHGGHPAHDIFITDKDQDALNDITKRPVHVLSVSYGVVVATETSWQTGSLQRGGNYIWVYSPSTNSLCYYAHNTTVTVKPGDIVAPGTIIATVGRTGANAAKKRSPTHLHFMQMQLDKNGYPRPVNPYSSLQAAETKNEK